MDEIEFFTIEETRLKEKQAKCLHRTDCNHPSFVCLLCSLHIDTLQDEQRVEIQRLHELISAYELLTEINRDEVINTLEDGVFL